MAVIVQKFGGSSIASLERLRQVAQIVENTKLEGHDVVVVVSAMGGETDRLIQMAKTISQQPSAREYAMLVTTGEQVSMSLLSMALKSIDVDAVSLTGAGAGIRTSNQYEKAKILSVDPSFIQNHLSQNRVVVVAGFQGIDDANEITTLGRGGSDTTAVAIAAALNAKECQIYTDVEGVYTTDPHVVPDAKRLNRLSFDEMLALSSLGAKVLQIEAVDYAGQHRVPLRVLSSFHKGPGTLISYDIPQSRHQYVTGIAAHVEQAKITVHEMPSQPNGALHILQTIRDAGIQYDMLVQTSHENDTMDCSFTVHGDDYLSCMHHLNRLNGDLGAKQISGDTDIAKLSLIGRELNKNAQIPDKMLAVLSNVGIPAQMQSADMLKVSVLVDEKYHELGVRTLHEAFVDEMRIFKAETNATRPHVAQNK